MPDPSPLSRPGYFPPPPASATAPQPIPRWTWFVGCGVLVVFLVLAVAGWKTFRRTRVEAHSIVDPLHAEMRRHDVDAIFRDSDPSWQKNVGLAETRHLFGFVNAKLGDPVDSTMVGVQVNADNSGEEKTWTFQTHFTKGDATETVTMRETSSGPKLWKYTVQTPLIKDGEYEKSKAASVTVAPETGATTSR